MKKCEACGSEFVPKSEKARFCRLKECVQLRARARKQDQRSGVSVLVLPVPDETVESAARRELAGLVDTTAGRAVLVLARQLDGGRLDTGSAKAAVAKQLQAMMADLLAQVRVKADPVDELQQKRAERRANAHA